MKSAGHALTILVFLLFSSAAFAVQSGTNIPPKALANPKHVQLRSVLPAGVTPQQRVNELFMPVPLSAAHNGANIHGSVQGMTAGYSSAVPLLSCIGAGMAIGGLISVRLTRRLHR